MKRHVIAAYGVACYLLFFATFLYLVAFLAGVGVPKGIDDGAALATPLAHAITIAIDIGLILLFGVQHSIMARAGFKRVWTKLVPPAAERSSYVLASSLALIVLFLFWQPLPAVVWSVETTWLQVLLWALFLAGWGLLFVSTFMIDHFSLFGLRQVWDYWRGQESPAEPFTTRGSYRWVRHPLMTGFLMAFWFVPHMSVGHFLFSAGMSAYIVIGTLYEERDLIGAYGQRYRDYAAAVPRFIPRAKRARPRAPLTPE